MRKGFTLAEVLITLAVIGVVAALTIPTVVQNYQKKQLYTQFMKVYNTLSDAMELSVADNGDTSFWDNSDDMAFEKYIVPYLKVSKICDPIDDCLASSYASLDGRVDIPGNMFNTTNLGPYVGTKAALLADGSVISANMENKTVYFLIDSNGKKGPNVIGRDMFTQAIHYNYGDHNGLYLEKYNVSDDGDGRCNPNETNTSFSTGCPSRMIQEGKMDY